MTSIATTIVEHGEILLGQLSVRVLDATDAGAGTTSQALARLSDSLDEAIWRARGLVRDEKRKDFTDVVAPRVRLACRLLAPDSGASPREKALAALRLRSALESLTEAECPEFPDAWPERPAQLQVRAVELTLRALIEAAHGERLAQRFETVLSAKTAREIRNRAQGRSFSEGALYNQLVEFLTAPNEFPTYRPLFSGLPAGFGDERETLAQWLEDVRVVRNHFAHLQPVSPAKRALVQFIFDALADALAPALAAGKTRVALRLYIDADDAALAVYAERMRLELQAQAAETQRRHSLPLHLGGERGDVDVDNITRFNAWTRWIDLHGRDAEMELLRQFRASQAKLGLMLIHAPGGFGKTRLALDAALEADAQDWDAGFLQAADLASHDWSHWRPDAPCFIVVDYASNQVAFRRDVGPEKPPLARMLDAVAAQGEALTQKVRLVLLDRVGGLKTAADARAHARAATSWAGLLFASLSAQVHAAVAVACADDLDLTHKADTSAIVAEVFRRRLGTVPPSGESAALGQLRRIDPRESPLFAVLVADAAASGRDLRAVDRLDFLAECVDHQSRVLHAAPEAFRAPARLATAVATLSRGVSVERYKAALAALKAEGVDVGAFVAPDNQWGTLRNASRLLTGAKDADAPVFHEALPDLLGEAFVLVCCRESRREDDGAAEVLRELAWRASQSGESGYLAVAEMVALIGSDFPAAAEAAGLFAPPRDGSAEVVASYAVAIASVVTVVCERKGVEEGRTVYDRFAATATRDGVAGGRMSLARAKAAFNLCNALLARDGATAASRLYETELRAPAEALGASESLRIERAQAAFNIFYAFSVQDSPAAARTFYEAELRAPALSLYAAQAERNERARAAFNLFIDISKQDGTTAARAFYEADLRAPAEGSAASEGDRIERAKAAFSLCDAIFAQDGPAAARAFYETELRAPAEAPGAAEEIRLQRTRAAGNLVSDLSSKDGADAARGFYQSELRAATQSPSASERERVARSQAAYNLCIAISRQDGASTARAFYETEICAPAQAPNAAEGERSDRARAAFNLCNDLSAQEGISAALAFYETELRTPAQAQGAAEDIRLRRAWAAVNLCNAVAVQDGTTTARAFYETELRAPAESLDATEGERIERAKAAFNLMVYISAQEGAPAARAFYAIELRALGERIDAPEEVNGLSAKALAFLGAPPGQNLRLPESEPAAAVAAAENLVAWPCVTAASGGASFAGLVKQPAERAAQTAFAALAQFGVYENLHAFDPIALRVVETPALHPWRIALLPHRENPIEVPFLVSDTDIRLLDRKNVALYACLEARGEPISPSDLPDLVRLFLAMAAHSRGKFHVVEPGAPIPWLPSASAALRDEIAGLLQPLALVAPEPDGRWRLRGTMLFQHALVRGDVLALAQPSPNKSRDWLEWKDGEPLRQNLPVDFGPAVDLLVTY